MSKRISAERSEIAKESLIKVFGKLGVLLVAGLILTACSTVVPPSDGDGDGDGMDVGCTPACATGETCQDGQCVADEPIDDPVDEPTDGGGGGGTTGDVAAGEAFYNANTCAICHCADAVGECVPGSPALIGTKAQSLLSKNDGTEAHVGGTVEGITQQDADDMAAWLASL